MSNEQVRPGAAAKQRVDSVLGSLWWAILLRGILALALAGCAFAWPQQTIDILVKILGIFFLIDGVIAAAGALRSQDKSSPLLQAVVSLAIGLVLLLWSGVSAKIFLILVGLWLAMQGISLFWAAMKTDPAHAERGTVYAIAAAMAIIGLVFVFWPNTGVVAVSWLIAIGALILGCLLLYMATVVKRVQTRVADVGQRID